MRLATNDLIGDLVPNCPRCAHGGVRVVRCKYCACSGQGREGVSGSRLAWGRATALEARGAADEGRSCLRRSISATVAARYVQTRATNGAPAPGDLAWC